MQEKTDRLTKEMVLSTVSTMTVPFTLIRIKRCSFKLSRSINKTCSLVIFVFNSKLLTFSLVLEKGYACTDLKVPESAS